MIKNAEKFTPLRMECAECVKIELVYRSHLGTAGGGDMIEIDKDEPEFEIIRKAVVKASSLFQQRIKREKEQLEHATYLKLKDKFEGSKQP